MKQAAQSASPVSRWWVLFLVHFSVVAFALNFQMIPPLVPDFISLAGLTHTQAGALMGLFTLPGIFLALPGGRVADTIGPRNVALWSLSLLAMGPFIMLPLHTAFLYAGRLCSGIGGAVLVVVAPQIIARFFRGKELGLAMGIFNTAVPLGTILAFNFLGIAAGKLGIPVVLVITSSWTLAALVAFYLTYGDPPLPAPADDQAVEELDGTVSGNTRGSESLGSSIWIISGIWMLFNISILSYFTFSIDFFIAAGITPPMARFTSSLPMLLSIFLTPLAGFAMHRYGLRWSLSSIGCALSAGSLFLILKSEPHMALPWSFLLGTGIAMVPPVVFTIAGEVVPPSRVGAGYGLLTTIFNLGVFFGIPLMGRVRDTTGSYVTSFLFMIIFMLLGAVISLGSRRRKHSL